MARLHNESNYPKINWAYVAGYFDGEGHVSHHKSWSHFALGFTNTNLESLKAIQRFIGAGTIYIKPRPNIRCKNAYRLIVSKRRNVVSVARRMLPYSMIKREKLVVLIEDLANKRFQTDAITSLNPTLAATKIKSLYYEQGLTLAQVGKKLDLSREAPRRFMIKRGMPIRHSMGKKLTYAIAQDIRELYHSDVKIKQREIAKLYGLYPCTIAKIIRFEIWKTDVDKSVIMPT